MTLYLELASGSWAIPKYVKVKNADDLSYQFGLRAPREKLAGKTDFTSKGATISP
jgi:hypothetical protein